MIIRNALRNLLAITLLIGTLSTTYSQSSGIRSAADREIARREQGKEYAEVQTQRGDAAMQARDYETAFAYYRAAVDNLPLGGEATQDIRSRALDGFCEASVSLAKQRISEGRFGDAELIVDVVLEDQYAPNYEPAKKLRKNLNDPTHYNRTITPTHIANIEQVKQLLIEADGFYQSGRYDLAFYRYEEVLNIDKYNIAARRGMEKVNGARNKYGETARNHSRGTMIRQVEQAWELPVRRFDRGVSTIIEQPPIDSGDTVSITRKLDDIIIPNLEFNDASVREAIDFIKLRAAQLDNSEPDPLRKGINIVLKLDPDAEAAGSVSRIENLQLSDVPLRVALEYVAAAAGLKLKVEPYAVAIVPLSESTELLFTKEYKVPPSFIQDVPAAAGAADGGGFGGGTETNTTGLSTARTFLEASGVSFPEGASAQFIPSSSKLIVRNTQSNMDLIDSLVAISQATPPTQVEIQSKFLEVTQNNLEELGFDWLLGQFGLPFGSGVYGTGGTQGSQPGYITANGTPGSLNDIFPIQNGSGAPAGLFNPATSSGVLTGGTGQLTAGNRSGATAIRANALDGLLFGSPVGPAAGILSLAGVFTNPQFQVVIRAMSQSKGIDLMSAPSVTTKSGQMATIDIIREFIYPSDYDPPQVPQEQDTYAINPAIPATPSEWTMEPVGVTLEVEPNIGADGFTIDLNLRPKVTEFEGFINYGSPIYTTAETTGTIDDGTIFSFGSNQIVLTENAINQPVFSVREITTNVTIYDGQTIVLGGLMREDVQKVQDKTPIIGDIPLAGRLFRSESSLHQKRNLLIFVTANLVDPAGQPLLEALDNGQMSAEPSPDLLLDEDIPGDPASIDTQL
ncbi:MAG: Amuc_1098 family type IV pilus outer membrane protein [Chthoniobacterales bacterium]